MHYGRVVPLLVFVATPLTIINVTRRTDACTHAHAASCRQVVLIDCHFLARLSIMTSISSETTVTGDCRVVGCPIGFHSSTVLLLVFYRFRRNALINGHCARLDAAVLQSLI